MGNKIGRPKSENPKLQKITIRLDAETDRKLREYCDRKGICIGEVIRNCINSILGQK
jgi:hypothetical protein